MIRNKLFKNRTSPSRPVGHQPTEGSVQYFELFLKYRLSLARALTSDTSLELAALIPHFVPPYKIINF